MVEAKNECRILDAAIAKIIGWQQVEYDEIGGEWTGKLPGEKNHLVIPYFSTDMTAAMLAFDWLVDAVYKRDKDMPVITRDYDEPCVGTVNQWGEWGDPISSGTTYADAICKAVVIASKQND